jgi:DNA-binding SARP family transcriptional activator/anti-anti-sigma regulatory factor
VHLPPVVERPMILGSNEKESKSSPPTTLSPGPDMSTDQFPNRDLRIQVFGGPRLFYGREEAHLSPSQAALLGMLFGSPKPNLPRTTALAHLWPAENPQKARRCLNQLLYSLKKKVPGPPPFTTRGDELLRFSPPFSSDFAEFESALEQHAFPTCAKLLEQEFLGGIEHSVTREMEDWVDTRRQELRRVLRRGAERRWIECERAGDWEEACEAAEALQTLDPTNEGLLRRVMEGRAKMGLPWEADAAFSDFSDRMSTADLGPWTPAADTQALLDEIRSLVSDQGKLPSTGTLQAQPNPPLLGREEEKGRLRKTLRKTPAQALHGILLSGEAGIGKTRLIREALTGFPLEGKRVLYGGAAELEQMIPLNPLIEVFRGDQAGQALRALEEPWRTVLFGVMPSHYLGEGPIPEAPQIQPGSVPRRLYEAFHQLLLALTAQGPLILALEDLQWADDTTLSVLEFLIRRWDQGNLQFLLSNRSEEVRRNPVLGQLLENLRLDENFLEINLGDLDAAASEALIQHLSPKPLDASELSYLRSLAGGNPFFLIELTLEFLAGRLDPGVKPQEILSIPLSIRQVLRRRLSQLSQDAERALGTLTVFGRPLDIPGLARIGRLPGSKCLAGLDQLHQFRLVTSLGSEFTVPHELIRQTVYQDLGESRKLWLHERVARYLLRTRENPPPDELAVHFHRASAKPEAKHYSTEAANRAEASGAVAEALRFLRIAREYSEEPGEVTDLIGRMGHLNYLHQNLDEATPLLELASQRFRREGREGKALEAEIERIDCLAETGRLPHGDCLEELQRVKSAATVSGRWRTFHKALDVEAHLFDSKGDLKGVRTVLEQAQVNANKGDLEARCKAQTIIALNIYFGSPTGALAAARKAVEIANTTSDNDLALTALNRLILVLHYQGRLQTPEGQSTLADAEKRLLTCGDLSLRFNVRLNMAVWHLEIGQLPQALMAFETVRKVVHGIRVRRPQIMLQLNLGELGLLSFDVPFAKRSYANAEDLLTPTSPPFFRVLINAGLGLCALHEGNLGEARRREAEIPTQLGFWTFDPTTVTTFRAKMLLKRRDLGGAVALLDSVRAEIRERFIPAWLRLTLEQCRILKRADPEGVDRLAAEGRKVAEEFDLKERARQFQRSEHPGAN